jgi:hypothetical protein
VSWINWHPRVVMDGGTRNGGKHSIGMKERGDKNSAVELFNRSLTKQEREILSGVMSPAKIQIFLDSIPYSTDEFYRCPLRVLRERTAHCFDGALFAAAAMRRIGLPPLIIYLFPNDRDDEHLLAVYKIAEHWGAIGKSNFVGLRFREPVYRNLRELVMSYFEQFYNIEREKTLRGYAGPLNLTTFDHLNWMTRDEHLEAIATRIDAIRRKSLLTKKMIARLSHLDKRSYEAGLLGTDRDGLYQPLKQKNKKLSQ